MPELDLPILALAILVLGTPVLLPSIHLAVTGELGLGTLLLALLVATQAADAAWYAFGRAFPAARLAGPLPLRRRPGAAQRLAERVGPRALFAARFLYGTKIAANVACGARRLPFPTFAAVNLASAALWFAFLVALVVAAGSGLEAVSDRAVATRVVLALLAVMGVGVNLLSRRVTARRAAPAPERSCARGSSARADARRATRGLGRADRAAPAPE